MKNYDPASPIQNINGLITTERSGLGKWGPKSRAGLIEFCQWMRVKLPQGMSRVVEVGAYAGESSCLFAMVCDELVVVDPWVNGYDKDDLSSHAHPMIDVMSSFNQRMSGFRNVKVRRETSEEAAKWISDGSCDLVYLDAIHKIGEVRDDINRWIPKLRKGGYIAGHDFDGYWGEVVNAVLETVGVPDVRFRDGSWAKKIN
jgi:hypothetical protein